MLCNVWLNDTLIGTGEMDWGDRLEVLAFASYGGDHVVIIDAKTGEVLADNKNDLL